MIPLVEAQRLIQAFQPAVPGTERVPVEEAAGRVLAERPSSDQDLPPFDRVTMDGYAVRSADLARTLCLRCIGEVAAGAVAPRPLREGEVYRIMTGAPLPAGADAVVMVEETREEGDQVHFERPARAGQNVHARGEDLREGASPLEPGSRVTSSMVPLLATLGRREVTVVRRPRVAVLTSGDELVEPEQRPGPGQIRDSNRFTLAAQVRSAGGEARCLPIVRDDREALGRAVAEGLECDLLLLTGGASVGRYDFSREVVARAGAEVRFEKVAIKPGKPVIYAVRDVRQVFCLPGNPVSAFVTFEVLVRAAIERCLGLQDVWPEPLRMPLTDALGAPAARDLLQVGRVLARDGTWVFAPLRWHGSGDLVTMHQTGALAHVPRGRNFAAGDEVAVLPLRHAAESLPRRREPAG